MRDEDGGVDGDDLDDGGESLYQFSLLVVLNTSSCSPIIALASCSSPRAIVAIGVLLVPVYHSPIAEAAFFSNEPCNLPQACNTNISITTDVAIPLSNLCYLLFQD